MAASIPTLPAGRVRLRMSSDSFPPNRFSAFAAICSRNSGVTRTPIMESRLTFTGLLRSVPMDDVFNIDDQLTQYTGALNTVSSPGEHPIIGAMDDVKFVDLLNEREAKGEPKRPMLGMSASNRTTCL